MHKLASTVILSWFLFLPLHILGQNLSLPCYSIDIKQENLEALYLNPLSDNYHPAIFTYNSISYPCEVRFRGTSSRELIKKSWKIKFLDDNNVFNTEKLNLNAEFRDTTMLRNYLAMKLFEFLDYPAPEVEFISLKINGDYFGVYVQVEQVDESFFKKRSKDVSFLYKGVKHGANMSPLMDQRSWWLNWEPKITTPKSLNVLKELFADFYYWTPSEFNSQIEETINLDNFINYYACMYCISSVDCFTKNVYISRNIQSNSFEIYPWDNDASFGNTFNGIYMSYLSSLTAFPRSDNQIFLRRIMENPDFMSRLSEKVNHISSAGFEYLRILQDSVSILLQNDQSFDPYIASVDNAQALVNLKDFLIQRSQVLQTYSFPNPSPLSEPFVSNGLPTQSDTRIIVRITSSVEQDVFLQMTTDLDYNKWGDSIGHLTYQLYDDGNHHDGLANDLVYGNTLHINNLPKEIIPFYFSNQSNFDYPYNGAFNINIPNNRTTTLAINNTRDIEFKTGLDISLITQIADNLHIELHNTNQFDYDISLCFFQSGEHTHVFQIPLNTIIPAQDKIIITNNTLAANQLYPKNTSVGNFFFSIQEGDMITFRDPAFNPIFQAEAQLTPFEYGTPPVVINEINYCFSDTNKSDDWIELYNTSNAVVDLSGWILMDYQEDNHFEIPKNTNLLPNQYLVLCRKSEYFIQQHPYISEIIGDFEFNLNAGGDLIRLYNNVFQLVDSVHYDNKHPWPTGTDVDGSTLELINPSSNNDLAINWRNSIVSGTPGEQNSKYQTIEIPGDTGFKLFHPYPNPFHLQTNISFSIGQTAFVELIFIDNMGRSVESVSLGWLNAGQHEFNWKPSDLPDGIFYVILKHNRKETFCNPLIHMNGG